MSGPIVRTGATPEYWENWDNVFGGKKPKNKSATAGEAATKSASKKKPAAKKKAAKKKAPQKK